MVRGAWPAARWIGRDGGDNGPFTKGLAKGEPFKLYLATNPTVRKKLKLKPFGIKVKPIDFCADTFEFDDQDYDVASLLEFVRLAHLMSSDERRRLMPRWMLVDLVLMPSGILLALAGQDQVGHEARKLEHGDGSQSADDDRQHAARLRDLLKVAHDRGYEGPLPVAGYAALPTLVPGTWVGGSLWWSLVPGCGLGYSVRRIALGCYKATREIGVTQFSNRRALRAQRGFGPLRVTHAKLAAHPAPHTFVYDVNLAKLDKKGWPARTSELPPKMDLVDPDDVEFDSFLSGIDDAVRGGDACYIIAPAAGSPRDSLPMIFTEKSGQPEQRAALPLAHSPRIVEGGEKEEFFAPGIRSGLYQPYVISNDIMLGKLQPAPFGIDIGRIDLCATEFDFGDGTFQVAELLHLLSQAIAQSYAESGLGMPMWAMVELALMPSAVLFVLAAKCHLTDVAEELAKEPVIDSRQGLLIPLAEDDVNRLRNANALRELLKAAKAREYEGPIPVAGYAAAPTPETHRWVGWSLWSLIPGCRLGYTVKRLGMASYDVRKQSAVIQYRMARGLDVIAKFGMLRLTTADVRPHPDPLAFIYQIDARNLPGNGAPARDGAFRTAKWRIDPQSDDLYRDVARLKYRIKRGTRFYLVPRTAGRATSPMIPVYQETPWDAWLVARTKLTGARFKDWIVGWRRYWYTTDRHEMKRRID